MISQLTQARLRHLAARDVANHIIEHVRPNNSEYSISSFALDIAIDGNFALIPGKLLLAWTALRFSDCASMRYIHLLNREKISVVQQKNGIELEIDVAGMLPSALSVPDLLTQEIICCSYDTLRYDIQQTLRRRCISLPAGMHRATHIFRYIRAAEMKAAGRTNDEISHALGHVSPDAVSHYITTHVVDSFSSYI